MMKSYEVNKTIKSISKEKLTASEILAVLEVDYDDEVVAKIEKILSDAIHEYKQIADNSVKSFLNMVDASVELDSQTAEIIAEILFAYINKDIDFPSDFETKAFEDGLLFLQEKYKGTRFDLKVFENHKNQLMTKREGFQNIKLSQRQKSEVVQRCSEIKFKVNEPVKVQLDHFSVEGKVSSIRIDQNGIWYQISYRSPSDNKITSSYLLDTFIKPLSKNALLDLP